MAQTYAQPLDAVQTAISALEGNSLKRFRTANGTEYEYKDLDILYQREERLVRLVSGDASVPMQNRVAEF